MIKKNIKFPLKMGNGIEVRNIENLRANADIESIMKYYLSGQLNRWCKAYGYKDILECLKNSRIQYVKTVCNILGISITDDEIQAYLSENPSFSFTTKQMTDGSEEEFPVVDNTEIKIKIKQYVNLDINLDDYEIEVSPIYNEDAKITKYKITIANNKIERYTGFSLTYELKGGYTTEHFQNDMYLKIAHAVNQMKLELDFNSLRLLSLKVKEKFKLGRFEGKPIEWIVLKKEEKRMLVLSMELLTKKIFDGSNNNWNNSDIRHWLNNDFYNTSFESDEKAFISGEVTLLTKDEAGELMSQNDRITNNWWWLRSTSNNGNNFVWYIHSDGSIRDSRRVDRGGGFVRPALWINLES